MPNDCASLLSPWSTAGVDFGGRRKKAATRVITLSLNVRGGHGAWMQFGYPFLFLELGWTGRARPAPTPGTGIGMLLFTEPHLEYNAGLVISIGNRHQHSSPPPMEHESSAAALAKNLHNCRLALVSRARPPETPTEAAISGTMFAPFVGVPMQTALDLCIVWSLYGLYMCKNFWPCPANNAAQPNESSTLRWPRQSHPNALTPAGQERTPWLTSWARATFEQGVLSVLPMLEGPCTVTSLPGEHLFQASALLGNRMRPAIFHAFGKAKVGKAGKRCPLLF